MTLNYKELKKEFRKKEREIRRREDVGISKTKSDEVTPSQAPTKKEVDRSFKKQILWEYLVGK
jgi:hypothetical protein